MDSFGLRQEQSELLKSVNELKHQLEIGEDRMKELHSEEMRYLEEIPVYKKQAEESKNSHGMIEGKTVSLRIELDKVSKELERLKLLVIQEEKSLSDLKNTEKKIIEETKIMNDQIKQRHEKLKERESVSAGAINDIEIITGSLNNKESELDKREFAISQRESKHKEDSDILDSHIEVHEINVNSHNDRIRTFEEQKRFYIEDEQLLKDKLGKADKLIKDQIELKASLLLQTEKLKKEIELTQAKQVSLDKNIADLVNQENALKIKELKLNKMAHDNGLIKELAELSK